MAMASLCPSPLPLSTLFTSPSKRGVPVEIVCYSASHRSSISNARRTVFGYSSLFRLVTRHISYSTHLKDNLGTTHVTLQTHSFSSPSMSQVSVVSGVTCKGLCTVLWSIETDIADGFVIYLTGDPVTLGCWDPNLAISLSRSFHASNLWERQIKVPCGIHFKYNYIIRHPSSVIEWRPGPEYSLSVPFSTGEFEVIRVRDCWMYESVHRFPVPLWGSWLADLGFSKDPLISALQQSVSSGEQKILKSQNGTPRKDEQSIIQMNGHGCVEISSPELHREKDGPIEEPWLFDSILLKLHSLIEEQAEVKEEQTETVATHPQRKLDVGSTVILVNSSVCTMQRIAVLEEGKLVELLLEPVKNKVHLDSIYLGVVTRFVPHLGGAFVDIGLKKPSLMDISQYRKPFVYGTDEKEEEREEEEREGDMEGICEGEGENLDDEFGEDAEVGDADVSSFVFRALEGVESRKVKRNQWVNVKKGTKIIVQVVREGLGTKGPSLTPYPNLRSRFWVLKTQSDMIGVSKNISGDERTRLRVIANMLKPRGFGLTVRMVAAGHTLEELKKDLDGLLLTWKEITDHAKSAALASDEGVEGAVPVILHRAMGQTLSVVQDYFNEKVKSMIVDSPRTYHEVTRYLQEMAPELCERVELYDKRTPIFDEYKIEEEINGILSKRVVLPNGGSLVIEQTEALVSIDVNAGSAIFGEGTSADRATLDVNLLAAKQIARELRLRDIGGIIVVDFIKMSNNSSKWKVFDEMTKAVKQDRSTVRVYELSDLGLMEISRKRVRPSVSFMISDPCICCQATGRVEALEMSFMKIENEIRRLLATSTDRPDPEDPKTWPKFRLRVDEHMNYYLTCGNSTKLAVLNVSLNVRISLKLMGTFPRGKFELIRLTEDQKGDQHEVIVNSTLQSLETRIKNPSGHFLIKKLRSRAT
ncbi:Ribonuclease E/G-like protein [Rhynchospora pubera]|uniref:Ribonuclease E/G-like protein n=1 Tax=Rhynchospora pubera TaxID=906938 RepID=A0AAV8CKX2_9POAL|nr:Ribonuclease E/G-like protein [Rhynchospora pubera]